MPSLADKNDKTCPRSRIFCVARCVWKTPGWSCFGEGNSADSFFSADDEQMKIDERGTVNKNQGPDGNHTNYFNIKKQLTDDELFCSLQVTASNVPDDLEPTCLFVSYPKNQSLNASKDFTKFGICVEFQWIEDVYQNAFSWCEPKSVCTPIHRWSLCLQLVWKPSPSILADKSHVKMIPLRKSLGVQP